LRPAPAALSERFPDRPHQAEISQELTGNLGQADTNDQTRNESSHIGLPRFACLLVSECYAI
jgi:hypothetical protein